MPALPFLAISAALRLCQLSTGYPRSIFLLMHRTLHAYMYRVSRGTARRIYASPILYSRASVAFKRACTRARFRVQRSEISNRWITLSCACYASEYPLSWGHACLSTYLSSGAPFVEPLRSEQLRRRHKPANTSANKTLSVLIATVSVQTRGIPRSIEIAVPVAPIGRLADNNGRSVY